LSVLIGALPTLVYAQQVDAEGASTFGVVVIETTAIIATAVAWALACEQSLQSYVGAWLAATSVSVALFAVAQLGGRWSIMPAVTIVLSVGCLIVVAMRADVRSRYLIEEEA
jgi:hypothetical protein